MLILSISLLFTIVNFAIDSFDLLNPAFDFCAVCFLSSIGCVFYQSVYLFEIHNNTVMIISIAMLIFTILNVISVTFYNSHNYSKLRNSTHHLKIVELNSLWTGLAIFINIATLYFTTRYVSYVAHAFGRYGSYSSQLNMYNHILKFTSYTINGRLKPKPAVLSIGEPICLAMAFFFVGIVINNYLAGDRSKKIFFYLLPFTIYFLTTFLRGSRSAAFALLLGLIFCYYTIWHFKKGYSHGTWKFFIYLMCAGILVIIGFTLIRTLIGRASSTIKDSLFPYLGGPIVNLDLFLQTNWAKSDLFGKESFVYLYRYIGPKLNNANMTYMIDLPFNSLNGVNVGNVYTTFYSWIKDFGIYAGMILMIPLSMYYTVTYQKIKNGKREVTIRLLTYSYLFDSLIMLFFSNRFYEDVVNPVFIKFLVVLITIYFVFPQKNWIQRKNNSIEV